MVLSISSIQNARAHTETSYVTFVKTPAHELKTRT